MKPYNLVVLDKPRNLKAESPSKNCVSGIVPPAVSRLNQPLGMEARSRMCFGLNSEVVKARAVPAAAMHVLN